MAKERFDRLIAAVCARQHGVVSRAQVLRLGGTQRMIQSRIRSELWESFHPGVYRLAGSPSSWRQSLMAACLACGAGAVASHRSAGALWPLPGFPEGPVELSILGVARRSRRFVVHRVTSLAAVDITELSGIPVTTPTRTLIDIASVVPRDVVEEALDDALRRGLVTRARLRWRLDALSEKGRPGVGVIRALLDARPTEDSIPQSVFETRLLRLLKASGLPRPELQHQIRVGGRLIAIVDFAYPDVKLAIEAEGYRWHSGRTRWQRDLARRNSLTTLGWRVIHVTWDDLSGRPDGVTAAIRKGLAERRSRAGQPSKPQP